MSRNTTQGQPDSNFGKLKATDRFKPVMRKQTPAETPVHVKLPGQCTAPDGKHGTAMIDDLREKIKDGGGRNGELVDLSDDIPVVKQ